MILFAALCAVVALWRCLQSSAVVRFVDDATRDRIEFLMKQRPYQ
jgi:hypothetical protein